MFISILKILHLLQIFVVSLKEAKRTFLTPERTTLKKKKSSLIIKLGLKEAVCKISNSYLVGKCFGLKLTAFVNLGSNVQ